MITLTCEHGHNYYVLLTTSTVCLPSHRDTFRCVFHDLYNRRIMHKGGRRLDKLEENLIWFDFCKCDVNFVTAQLFQC